MLLRKYSFVVEEQIQERLDKWLKETGMRYESTIMYEVSNVRFRIYTVYYGFMNYKGIANLVKNKLKELRTNGEV